MTDTSATYHIETNTSVIDFESNIPLTMLEDFLRREGNRFDMKRFTEYVHSFKHVKNYFINIL